MNRLLGGDRTDWALIDRVLNAGGIQISVCLDLSHFVCSHLKHLGADLGAQSTTDTEIFIDCRVCHYFLLLIS